jgi:dTMP kinase
VNKDYQRLAAKLAATFLVFDGPDGCGKSTQSRMFADTLQKAGADVLVCRDPGGTEIGDRIRSVLLDHDLSTMDVGCETLLFMASRAQLVAQIVQPALTKGQTVICDRFVTATCAYQGAAGYDPRRVVELAQFAIGDCWPAATIVLDVDTEEGFERIGRKPHHAGKNRKKNAGEASLFEGSRPDAMEARSIEFHRRVRQLFLGVDEYYPSPVITIDGRGGEHAVHDRVMEALVGVLG